MSEPTVVFDIGGSKILAALVSGSDVLAEAWAETTPSAGPQTWIEVAQRLVAPWEGHYVRAAAAVTGLVIQGRWSALNPAVLPIPDNFPLEDQLASRLGGSGSFRFL